MAFILLYLLTPVGGRPAVQQRSEKDNLYRNKVSYIGLSFSIFHVILSIYWDSLSERQTAAAYDTFVSTNNVFRGTIFLVRLMSLILPPGYAVTTFYQSPAFSEYLNNLQEFDELLEGEIEQAKVAVWKLLLMDRVLAVIMFLLTVMNFLVIYFVFTKYYEVDPEAYNIYLNMFPITVCLLEDFTAMLHLVGTLIRMNCFIEIVKRLFVDLERNRNVIIRGTYY